jgi:hypothetical protein
LARFADPTNDLASIKWLVHAASFDYGEGGYLGGREPPTALATFPAPANGHTFLNRPRVNNPGVFFTAKWAFHVMTNPLSSLTRSTINSNNICNFNPLRNTRNAKSPILWSTCGWTTSNLCAQTTTCGQAPRSCYYI